MQLPQKPTPRVFSGMQPTGNLHLGNYLGAMVQLGRDAEEPRVHLLRRRHARHHGVAGPEGAEGPDPRSVTAAYMAARHRSQASSILFNQSQVPEHAELAWVFNCVARLGWLNRMTQFKEKAGKDRENASVGLYAYPDPDGGRHPGLSRHARAGRRRPEAAPGAGPRHRPEVQQRLRRLDPRRRASRTAPSFPLPEPVIMGPATRVMACATAPRRCRSRSPPTCRAST